MRIQHKYFFQYVFFHVFATQAYFVLPVSYYSGKTRMQLCSPPDLSVLYIVPAALAFNLSCF